MSLDDEHPTQYFGPHAKRWTNPVTGKTLSLRPADYERMRQIQFERSREWNEDIDRKPTGLERGDFDQDAAKRGIMNILDDVYANGAETDTEYTARLDREGTGAIHVDPPPTTLTVDNARISDIRLDENGIGSIQIDKREWRTGSTAYDPDWPGVIHMDKMVEEQQNSPWEQLFKDQGVVIPGSGTTVRKTDAQLCIEDANEYAADYVAQLERRARTAEWWNWAFAIAGGIALIVGLAGVR